jgi:hypothetical protein
LEVYSFPATADSPVYRFMTVGLSLLQHHTQQQMQCCELLLVLRKDLAGASTSDAMKVLLDVSAYALRHQLSLNSGVIIVPVSVFPQPWKTEAILLDDALAEPHEVALMQIGPVSVDLLWVIPLFASEVRVIESHGRETFDEIVQKSKDELINPSRYPIADA